MTTVNNPLKGSSEITLSVPLAVEVRNFHHMLRRASSAYQSSRNAKWKIAVSWANSKVHVTLYCCRKSSRDTLLAAYCARLISISNPYTRDFHQKGHATFSGPTLKNTFSFDLNLGLNLPLQIHIFGATSLQLHVTILEPDETMNMKIYEDAFNSVDKAQLFSSSSPYPSDCVIVFKGKKEVHVNKSLLSLYSEYWKNALADITKRKALSLPYADYDEFLELLSVIYPSGHPVTAKNVETLSKLAYEFGMSELLKRCDVFLMASSAKFRRSQLLVLAQNFKLERLQAQCISDFKSIDDVMAIKPEREYVFLDDRSKRMLLDKLLGINSALALPAAFVPESSNAAADPPTGKKRSLTTLNSAKKRKLMDTASCPWLQLISCPPDIALLVGNTRIPAHKQYLSMFSDFFNNMFRSEFKESRESEITLEEIRHDEILELLSVIYPSDEYSINEANIATIVKLADRFMMPIILERCKKELKNSDKIKGALKLWLAQQYGTLAELQKEFAYKYKSIEDVRKLKAEPEFDLLDDKVRALLLESITM